MVCIYQAPFSIEESDLQFMHAPRVIASVGYVPCQTGFSVLFRWFKRSPHDLEIAAVIGEVPAIGTEVAEEPGTRRDGERYQQQHRNQDTKLTLPGSKPALRCPTKRTQPRRRLDAFGAERTGLG